MTSRVLVLVLVLVSLTFFFPLSIFASTQASYTPSSDDQVGCSASVRPYQIFSPTSNAHLNSITIYGFNGTPSATSATLNLYAIDGSNKPTGDVLSTSTLSLLGITATPDGQEMTFSMSAYDISSSTSYAFVLLADQPSFKIDTKASGGYTYPAGVSYDSGVSYELTAYNFLFSVDGETIVEDSPMISYFNPASASASFNAIVPTNLGNILQTSILAVLSIAALLFAIKILVNLTRKFVK